jgi:hypothetical protein
MQDIVDEKNISFSPEPLMHLPDPHARSRVQPQRAPHPWDSDIVSQQPVPTTDMCLKGGNRNALNLPRDGPDNSRGWSNSLFDCFKRPDTCEQSDDISRFAVN